jgi:homoserine O-acetyltransferase
MTGWSALRRALLLAGLILANLAAPTGDAMSAEYPTPREATWIARDFRFHTGETLPELRLAYTTIGDPTGEPVLVLHGTGGSARSLLTSAFAGGLFGAGGSAKPSDGMRAGFPRYDYADMVAAQHRLVSEGLGVRHLRLVLGNSMGGMHAWLWGTTHPDFMDAIVPMAAQPTQMAARNWMLRQLLVESIRQDPAYANGNYREQPPSLRLANVFFATATNGGTLALQAAAPTRAAADALVEARFGARVTADANDFVYQWDSSRDYDPAPMLGRIRARVLAINAADDERNPPETGVMQAAMQRVPSGRLLLIPASEATSGHGTTGNALLWREALRDFLRGLE